MSNRHSTRNSSRGTTAQHLAQTDRRRAEHEARQNKAAGITPEPQISSEAVAAYRALIGPGAEAARTLRDQRAADKARQDAAYAEYLRQKEAGIEQPRPPMMGTNTRTGGQ